MTADTRRPKKRTKAWRSRLPIIGLIVICIGTAGSVLYVYLRPSGPTELAVVSRPGYSVAYPSTWSIESPPSHPTDVVLLIREHNVKAVIDPGLVLRRTQNDPYPVSHDVPALLMANRFSFPHSTVLRKDAATISGSTDAYVVVTRVSLGGVDERILDILIRTPAGTAYHLQAIAPASVLSDATISNMESKLRVG